MGRRQIASATLALVLASSVFAADSPEVQALKQQVKTLRAQKDAATKSIHAQYDAVINRTKLTEAQIAANKKALSEQEQTLAATDSSPDSKVAQQNIELLRQAMHGEIKLDNAAINNLRAQRHAHIRAVSQAFDAQIKQGEALIKAAQAQKSTSAKQKGK
jgi:hypothetical protein